MRTLSGRVFVHLRGILPGTVASALAVSLASAAPIPVQEPPAQQTPDFQADVFPFLSDNCVACHSKSTRKGGLNLETPADILKGGDSGPAAVAGKGVESLLIKASTHEDADSAMPPRDNKAKAKNLTPVQIGLLKRWIDQGAKPGKALVREVKWQPLPAHLRSILSVAFSSDGRWVACSRGNQLFVYENGTGKLVFQTEAHPDQIQALAFSPDSNTLASAGFREIKLWQRQQANPVLAARLSGARCAVSASGEWAAFADETSVRVRKLTDSDAAARAVDFTGPWVAMEWLENDAALALVSAQKKLAVWKKDTGTLACTVELPAAVTLVRAGTGGSVWTAGGDAMLREWNGATGAMVREFKGVPADVRALSVAGNRIAAGCASGAVVLWTGEGDQPKATLKSPAAVTDISLPGQGDRIAVAGADGVARVLDLSGKVVASVKGDSGAVREAESAQRRLEVEEAVLVALKEVLAEAQKSETAAKDRVKKSTEAVPLKAKEVEPKKKPVEEAVAARDAAAKKAAEAEAALKTSAETLEKADAARKEAEKALAGATANAGTPPAALEEAKKKDMESVKALESARTANTAAEAAKKSASEALEAADKKKLAAESDLEKAEKASLLAVAEVPLAQAEEQKMTEAAAKAKADVTAQEAAKALAQTEKDALRKKADAVVPITAIHLASESGPLLVGHGNGLVQVCAASNGTVLATFGERRENGAVQQLRLNGERAAAVSADGAVWAAELAQKWSHKTTLGDAKTAVPFRDRVLAIAFSRDGNQLAASSGEPSREGDLFLWDTKNLTKEARRLSGAHSDTILALAFSPDGKAIVTGGADKVARIIDIEPLKVRSTLEGHTHHVLSVDWSPDGRTIVTGGGDNAIKIWDALTGIRKKNVDGAEKEVTSVRFIGSGGQFAAASGDGKVRVVGSTGTVARSIPAATSFVNALHAPLLGSAVATGGQDGVLRLWNAADGSKIAEFGEAP